MNKKEKNVGILGGMGPYATVHFFKQILDLTPSKKNLEHLRILIDNNVKIPSRTRALLYNEKSPVPFMITSINNLALLGADFVVVPCNSAHYFYEEVLKSIKIPWLNLIEIVSNSLRINKRKKPLILGGYIIIKKRLYSKFIPKAIYPLKSDSRIVFNLIEEIKKTNSLTKKSFNSLMSIISKNKNKADSIVLACTELPIVIPTKTISGLKVFDVNEIYAKETIKYAQAKH